MAAISLQKARNTLVNPLNTGGVSDSSSTVQRELGQTEEEKERYWNYNCQSLSLDCKVGEVLQSHDVILFKIEAQDVWTHVKINMKLEKQ